MTIIETALIDEMKYYTGVKKHFTGRFIRIKKQYRGVLLYKKKQSNGYISASACPLLTKIAHCRSCASPPLHPSLFPPLALFENEKSALLFACPRYRSHEITALSRDVNPLTMFWFGTTITMISSKTQRQDKSKPYLVDDHVLGIAYETTQQI